VVGGGLGKFKVVVLRVCESDFLALSSSCLELHPTDTLPLNYSTRIHRARGETNFTSSHYEPLSIRQLTEKVDVGFGSDDSFIYSSYIL